MGPQSEYRNDSDLLHHTRLTDMLDTGRFYSPRGKDPFSSSCGPPGGTTKYHRDISVGKKIRRRVPLTQGGEKVSSWKVCTTTNVGETIGKF